MVEGLINCKVEWYNVKSRRIIIYSNTMLFGFKNAWFSCIKVGTPLKCSPIYLFVFADKKMLS